MKRKKLTFLALGEPVSEPKEWELSISRMEGGDMLSASEAQITMFPDARFSLFSSYNVQSPNSTQAEQIRIRDAVLNSPKVPPSPLRFQTPVLA